MSQIGGSGSTPDDGVSVVMVETHQKAERKIDEYEALRMSSEVEQLVAVNTQEYERYQRGFCHGFSPYRDRKQIIKPGPSASPLLVPQEHNGWRTFVHPEGLRYFFRDDPKLPVPILTEAWIYDGSTEILIRRYVDEISTYMDKNNLDFRPDPANPQALKGVTAGVNDTEQDLSAYVQGRYPIVLVLERRRSGKVGYYFVHHPMQRLFWLDEFDFSHDVEEVNIEHEPSHVGLEMRSHYWTHNEFFPHLYELTDRDLVEIDNLLSFGLGDIMSSTSSCISAYTAEQLKYIQKTMRRYEQKGQDKRRQSTGDGRTLYRALRLLYHERFLNLYGERGARLDAQQSIHYSPYRAAPPRWYQRVLLALFTPPPVEDPEAGLPESELDLPVDKMRTSSILMKVVALFMFGGPAVHAERLREVTRDRNINSAELAKYAQSMVAEWRDVALYGTVLLGANISFLAIQSIDEVGSEGPTRTPSQRASYFSVLCSMGSIAASLALLTTVRHHEMEKSFIFTRQVHLSRWVLESHALTYSMPLSLAVWSLLSFFISFAIIWFDSTDKVVMWLTASACFVYVSFLLTTLLTFYLRKNPVRGIGRWIKRVVKGAVGWVATGTRGRRQRGLSS